MIKKLVPLQSQQPQNIESLRTLDLSKNDEIVLQANEPIEVSPKYILGYNMKKNESARNLRIKEKQLVALNSFLKECEQLQRIFKADDNKYNDDTVQIVMQIAEDYFVSHKQLGDLKKRAVISVCKSYFNDDIDLVSKIIEMSLYKVKKSTVYRRHKKQIKKAALFFLTLLGLNVFQSSQQV